MASSSLAYTGALNGATAVQAGIGPTVIGMNLATAGCMIGGAAAGVVIGGAVEIGLQEFEKKFSGMSYEAKYHTTQGVRTILFGAGVGVSVATMFGLIAGGSILAAVTISSAGIGLAVVAAIGIGCACIRYRQFKKRQEALDHFVKQFDIVHDDDAASCEFLQNNGITYLDVCAFVEERSLDVDLADRICNKVRRLLRGAPHIRFC